MIIDGHAYTREEWLAHVKATTWTQFSSAVKKPIGVTLHNTWKPTIASWTETDPRRLAALHGLKSYYEGLGWHAGPHAFVSRQFINGFSPLNAWGIHSTCFNHTHIGIEMIGNYAHGGEDFNSGDGALVRDNAAFAVAALMLALGLAPETALVFHKDCTADHHDCPGNGVDKLDMERRIRAQMGAITAAQTPVAPAFGLGAIVGQKPALPPTHGAGIDAGLAR